MFLMVGKISDNADSTAYQIDVRAAESHGGRFTSADSIAVRNIVIEVCIKAGSAMKTVDRNR
jgi:hypothetical protein